MSYAAFLAAKEPRVSVTGTEPVNVHSSLYPFQADIVRWACRRGRAAVFADCGMGKTRIQLEWSRQIGGRVLIVAPLAVAAQTIAEAAVMGMDVRRIREPDGLPGVAITNYERIHRFVGAAFDGIVLDESSILKSVDGKTRTLLLEEFTGIPFRLCCTATPAPNDVAELANHAEFVGAMSRVEMLATYFVHDEDGWRLKGHAADAMWRWLAQWAVYVRRPSDLGHADDGFLLPPLTIREEHVRTDWRPDGMLVATSLGGVGGRAKVRKHTLAARVARAAEVIAEGDGQWLVWCGLNAEGRELARALGDAAVLIEGADSEDAKVEREARWRRGEVRTLISKSSMFGFGMNWQHCARMLFLGIGDSYEQYYQAIRRCWRFGQARPVDVRIVVSEAESEIVANVRRKEQEAAFAAERVVVAMRETQIEQVRSGHVAGRSEYTTNQDGSAGEWELMLGDCIERIREVKDGSVGMSVFSPPFASLYTYSASDRDLGNCKDYDEFFGHFAFLIPELLRATMPGRRACVHVQQVTTTLTTHGVIGWRDFRADVVRAFVAAGWVYDGEVVIDKDPQAQAIRTKAKALMFVQKNKDSSWSRPAMADYILLFRHPGENAEPIKTDVSNEEWISWARPIWYGIRESDTLQYHNARADKDEKHICPLQLGTIERCVRLWSNRGDLVLSPFAGIGSEGYVSLKFGRRFVGIELKPEYWRAATNNLRMATAQQELFSSAGTGECLGRWNLDRCRYLAGHPEGDVHHESLTGMRWRESIPLDEWIAQLRSQGIAAAPAPEPSPTSSPSPERSP